MIVLGVFLHALGGFAAGSFYLPFKKVRDWAWESYWLVGGVASWIVMPLLLAVLTVPNLGDVLRNAPKSSMLWCYIFGLLWGIGGLTFGLSVRYLGLSLGYAVALGFCAAFGTIIPPIYRGEFGNLVTSVSGLVTLGGVLVCLAGIAICGRAGVLKEKELSTEQKQKTIAEFDFTKGLWVAIFAGIMSACMAFGISAGEPIAELALARGTHSLWQNSPVFVFVLAGGFTTNFLWCIFLNVRNRSADNYLDPRTPLGNNYIFSILAGATWYLQFMFYGMGETRMGDYGFSSWTIHMAFIIVFSNIWGILLHEWKGTSRRTIRLVCLGIAVLIVSTLVVGLGSYLKYRSALNNPEF